MSGLPYGLGAMLKDGHKHLSGLQEAVIKNIEACKELSMIARTSLGPNGEDLVFRISEKHVA
jgi:T-complex protein 1 subunit theta